MDTFLHPASLERRLRAFTHVARHWRALNSQARVDVVGVYPVLDEAERQRRFADPGDRLQQAAGARIGLQGILGEQRDLNLTRDELRTRAGRALGRELVLQAADWAQQQGARVLLLGSGLRDLFGPDAAALRARCPELLITPGDNGRAWLLAQEVPHALAQGFGPHAGWRPRVLLLAPEGPLGSVLSGALEGAEVLGWGPDPDALRAWAARTGLRAVERFEDIGPVDAVVALSSDPRARLDFMRLQQLRRRRRQLMVFDAAEQPALDRDTLDAAQGTLWRQDAGQARTVGRRAGVLGLDPRRSAVGGAWAEALALFHSTYRLRSGTALRRNWFEVGSLHQLLVGEALRELGLTPAPASSFGQAQKDWVLQLPQRFDPLLPAPPEPLRGDAPQPAWR